MAPFVCLIARVPYAGYSYLLLGNDIIIKDLFLL